MGGMQDLGKIEAAECEYIVFGGYQTYLRKAQLRMCNSV